MYRKLKKGWSQVKHLSSNAFWAWIDLEQTLPNSLCNKTMLLHNFENMSNVQIRMTNQPYKTRIWQKFHFTLLLNKTNIKKDKIFKGSDKFRYRFICQFPRYFLKEKKKEKINKMVKETRLLSKLTAFSNATSFDI